MIINRLRERYSLLGKKKIVIKYYVYFTFHAKNIDNGHGNRVKITDIYDLYDYVSGPRVFYIILNCIF